MAVAAYNNDIFTAFAFLGFFIVMIPLKWHIISWNTGSCMYIAWTAIGCLNMFINSTLWKGTALDIAPIWCDISTHLQVGLQVAIPAASLCINRRLYLVTCCRRANYFQSDKRRMVLCDLAICLGLPIAQMICYTIPQGHRYDIYEDVGCVQTIYNTPMAIVFVYIWPIIIGLVSAVYCGLTLRSFLKRRKEMNEILGVNGMVSFSRYFRLMGLAAADLVLTVPLCSWALYLNVTSAPVHPWLGWADTHENFARVIMVPSVNWHLVDNVANGRELQRWSPIICAFVFFALFGFAQEARRQYVLLVNTIGKWTGIESLKSLGQLSQPTAGSNALPQTSKGTTSATEPKGGPSDSFFAHVDFSALTGVKDGYSPTTTGPSRASLPGSPLDDEKRAPFAGTETGSSRASLAPSLDEHGLPHLPGLGRIPSSAPSSRRGSIEIGSPRHSLDIV